MRAIRQMLIVVLGWLTLLFLLRLLHLKCESEVDGKVHVKGQGVGPEVGITRAE